MKTNAAKIGFTLLASLATLAVAHTSDAGQTWGNGGAFCFNENGTGYCEGSLEGFRTASDGNALAYFSSVPPSYAFFYGYVNGVGGGCSGSAAMLSQWQAIQSAAPQTGFYIQWSTSTGQCTALEITDYSSYF